MLSVRSKKPPFATPISETVTTWLASTKAFSAALGGVGGCRGGVRGKSPLFVWGISHRCMGNRLVYLDRTVGMSKRSVSLVVGMTRLPQ